MPITINGSGTVTGISVGGLPDGVVTTADLDSNVPVTKAWVNFDGTGTVAIRASYNVSSITDNGAGDYTVNFTTAMPDANYSAVAIGGNTSITSADTTRSIVSRTLASSSLRVVSCRTDSIAQDIAIVNVAIFR